MHKNEYSFCSQLRGFLSWDSAKQSTPKLSRITSYPCQRVMTYHMITNSLRRQRSSNILVPIKSIDSTIAPILKLARRHDVRHILDLVKRDQPLDYFGRAPSYGPLDIVRFSP